MDNSTEAQSKGNSPFSPGQPVPVELFVGRAEQIDRILKRGAGQVKEGKPVAMFIQGEYGIGKSSIASYSAWLSTRYYDLHEIYVPLGGVETLEGLASALLKATIRSGAFDLKRNEVIQNWLSKYIGKQGLFSFSLNLDALKKDAPSLTSHFEILDFLSQAKQRLSETGVKGIFLIFDEINGIASNPQFAFFIKSLVDTNALSKEPLSLLLMLVAHENRRRELIKNHEPLDRIFDVIDIAQMSDKEVHDFFIKAFNSVNMTVTETALNTLIFFSAGFPKIMHLLGDNAFWIDEDGNIDDSDAMKAIEITAVDVGKKFVKPHIYDALKSPDYRSILSKIALMGPDKMTFSFAEISQDLTESEKKKLGNFLQKMKKLNAIKPGETKGEYEFTMLMVRFFIWLEATDKN
jgi:hypothetical protein